MKTGLLTKCTVYDFEKLFKAKGYVWFTKGNYNLNIIGIRSNNKNKVTNKYDDMLVVDYNTGNGHKRVCYTITTEPGLYYIENLCNSKGAAILVPGQYRGCWQIGVHRGKYKALCQKKEVKVYRDNNKNQIYDWDPATLDEGLFGINIHKAGKLSQRVDTWSAGCQVLSSETDFKAFMNYCNKQVQNGLGKNFTYTLLKEEELV